MAEQAARGEQPRGRVGMGQLFLPMSHTQALIGSRDGWEVARAEANRTGLQHVEDIRAWHSAGVGLHGEVGPLDPAAEVAVRNDFSDSFCHRCSFAPRRGLGRRMSGTRELPVRREARRRRSIEGYTSVSLPSLISIIYRT